MLAEAERAGVDRFVFVSSLGAPKGQSDYHRSKRDAERLVRQFRGELDDLPARATCTVRATSRSR